MNLFHELPFHEEDKKVTFSTATYFYLTTDEEEKEYRKFWQFFQLDRIRFKDRIHEFEKRFLKLLKK